MSDSDLSTQASSDSCNVEFEEPSAKPKIKKKPYSQKFRP